MKTYSVKGNRYGTYDSKKNFIPIGKNVTVTKVEKHVENNDIYITIEFMLGKIKQKIRCKGNNLQHRLNEVGYIISSSQMPPLNDYIQQQCDNIENNCIHSCIGWGKFEDEIIFKGHEALGIKSDYIGNLAIEPNGNVSDFIADYEKIIYGNTPLEASVIIGLSSCVVGYLSLVSDMRPTSIIIDANGKSTTGKTTCARLAVSMCGSLKSCSDKTSLSSTCSTTLNALYGQLADNFGYTILLDETARLGDNFDFTGMIYAVADGTDKARMQRNRETPPPKRWATTIIFTGEFPLLSKAKKAEGLSVRVIPFNNVKWTADQGQAHQVEEFSYKYAGLPLWELAKHIISIDSKGIIDLYKSEVQALTSRIPIDPCYQERVAKSIAVFTVTAKLAANALNIKFHENEILDFFLENLKGGISENESRSAFDFITNKCYENLSKFPDYQTTHDKSNYTVAKKDCWGSIRRDYSRKDGKSEPNTDLLIIVKDKFIQWMNEGGFTNVENILREWKSLGVILTQKSDHYYSYVVLQNGNPKTSCIRIILNNNAYSVDFHKKGTEKFSDIFCKQVLEAGYKKYASDDKYAGLLEAVKKTIVRLSEENLEAGFSEEIIKNCIKIDIDFPCIQSYLYGEKHDEWEKKKKTEDKNNALHDDDQGEQERLE